MQDLMQQLIEFISQHIAHAHWIIFGSLLLAGFNLPVSEDAMLFISGWLASLHPEYFYHLFFGVFMGAYLSDLICYYLGRSLGPKLWNIKFFANMVSKEQIDKVAYFYAKYGIITLILGRFIPFGVRNALFLTAGLGRMNFVKFALSDLLACTISSTTFFALYYNFGEKVIGYVKKGNQMLFIAVIIAAAIWFIMHKRKSRQTLL